MFFGKENGSKLVPKCDPKLISTLKAENQLNASRLAFSWLSGVEVGSQNQAKNDPKMESKMECILASDFTLLWSIFGIKLGWKMGQKTIKNCIEKPIEKRRAARWLSWASQGSRRPTTKRDTGVARAPAGSSAPRLANIKRQLNKQTST